MCCLEHIVLPGEDPALLQEEIELSILEHGARTIAERTEIENAVYSQWCVRRCRKAGTAAATRIVNQIEDGFLDCQAVRVKDLVERVTADEAADRAGAIMELRGLSLGILWILSEIDLLDEALENRQSLHPSERRWGILMFGRRPRDLFIDRFVMQWNLDYLGALHGPGKISAAQAAEILRDDRPEDIPPGEFARRLEDPIAGLADSEEAHGYLKASLGEVRKELLLRLEVIEGRERRDRAIAVQEATVDVSRDGMNRSRYLATNIRLRHAAFRALHGLKEMRRKDEAEEVKEQEAEVEGQTEPISVPEEPKVEGKTEPISVPEAVASCPLPVASEVEGKTEPISVPEEPKVEGKTEPILDPAVAPASRPPAAEATQVPVQTGIQNAEVSRSGDGDQPGQDGSDREDEELGVPPVKMIAGAGPIDTAVTSVVANGPGKSVLLVLLAVLMGQLFVTAGRGTDERTFRAGPQQAPNGGKHEIRNPKSETGSPKSESRARADVAQRSLTPALG